METLQEIFGGLIGVAMLILINWDGHKKTAKAANETLTLNKFLEQDFVAVSISFLSVGLLYLCFDEIALYIPILTKVPIISFFVMGLFGSGAIMYGFGRTSKIIRNQIDRKTNELDELLNNKNDKMEETFEWALAAHYEDDIALYNGEESPLPVFAQQTMGVLTGREIVYASEPAFASIEFRSNYMANYIAVPIRKPK